MHCIAQFDLYCKAMPSAVWLHTLQSGAPRTFICCKSLLLVQFDFVRYKASYIYKHCASYSLTLYIAKPRTFIYLVQFEFIHCKAGCTTKGILTWPHSVISSLTWITVVAIRPFWSQEKYKVHMIQLNHCRSPSPGAKISNWGNIGWLSRTGILANRIQQNNAKCVQHANLAESWCRNVGRWKFSGQILRTL